MRKLIFLALLSISFNCHAFFFDNGGMSITQALEIVQKQRIALLEKQLQEQIRMSPQCRGR